MPRGNKQILTRIDECVRIKWYERAAFLKGQYERKNATFLKRYKFLNEYKDYVKGLESR